MASRFLHEAQRGAQSGSIDLPLALVAGLSVGFVAFMMPEDILARLVETSRLPEFLSAAAPPLGAKARIGLAAAAAGATFAALFLLLRLLGRKRPGPKEPVWPEADTEREPETPRLRRSDVHPDAPARRPILATRELGEPAPAARREAAGPAPEASLAAAGEEALDLLGPGIEMLEPEPEDAPVAAPVAAAPPSLPREAGADPLGEASIAELMARLERGLSRRLGQDAAAARAEAQVPAPTAAPAREEPGDDRLRSAIETLQKMAARAG